VWNGGRILRRVDDGAVEIDVNSSVSRWDEHTALAQRIRNYTAKPIDVEVRRSYSGDVDFKADLPGLKLYDYLTPEFTVKVEAGQKKDFPFEIIVHHGFPDSQNRVRLVPLQ
jgi:hypothetical protein